MALATAHFDPNTLNALQLAYDEACQCFASIHHRLDQETRDEIALRIVERAMIGEREPGKLQAYALAGFAADSNSGAEH